MLIDFNKPTKTRSNEEHNSMYSSDSEIAGTYVPNMSFTDMKKWKGKRFNAGKDGDRIEIRKTIGEHYGTQLLIIVAKDGWNYKNHEKRETAQYITDTRGLNVRISMNGPLMMTFDEFDEIQKVVDEARDLLLS